MVLLSNLIEDAGFDRIVLPSKFIKDVGLG